MKKSLLFHLSLVLIISLFLNSCKKDDSTNDSTAVTDESIAEGESFRVVEAVNITASDYEIHAPQGTDSILPSCAVITVDTNSVERKIIIDFGSAPCQCANWDGRYRQGQIIATWNGAYRDSGTIITVITQDYYQGLLPSSMNKFEFVKTVTNLGTNANGNLHYDVNVTEGEVTYYSGETFTWISHRDREWIMGSDTWLWLDDVYSITGDASGTDRNGNPYSVQITEPLIFELLCPWVTQGVLVINSTFPECTIDFGDGSCDNKAELTINGVTSAITL